jgi:hypothetical protein
MGSAWSPDLSAGCQQRSRTSPRVAPRRFVLQASSAGTMSCRAGWGRAARTAADGTACKGSRLHRPCRARPADPVPGRGGPERRRRPPPDGAETPTGAALGPQATGRSRTTPANGDQPIAQVSSHFQAFAQVVRSPRCLSHGGSRRCPRFDTIPIERRMIRTAIEPRTQRCQGPQARRAASQPRKARTGFPAGPGSPGRSSVGGRPRYGRGAACPPAPSG